MIWMLIACGLFVVALGSGFVRVARIEAEARRRKEQAKARAAAAKAPPPAPTPPMRSYPGDLERPYRHAPAVHPHAPQNGASVFKMTEVSWHRSLDTLRGYVRRVDLFREHMFL